MISYAVARKTPELGLRLALGARTSELARMVAARHDAGAWQLAAGTLVALAAGRLVASQLYGVTPRDRSRLPASPRRSSPPASSACWLPARRAMKINACRNPTDYGRQDKTFFEEQKNMKRLWEDRRNDLWKDPQQIFKCSSQDFLFLHVLQLIRSWRMLASALRTARVGAPRPFGLGLVATRRNQAGTAVRGAFVDFDLPVRPALANVSLSTVFSSSAR